MIKVSGLSIRARKHKENILNEINIEIPEGLITVLTGESGVGKTIFAKTISGLLSEDFIITNGLFYLNNKEVEYSEIKKMTGKGVFYSPQNAKASLNPVLKIRTQFKDIKSIEFNEIENLMKELKFPDPKRILESYPFELSEGECQRIILIMGILLKPKLFILDEPTTALDVDTQKKMLEIIIKINKTYKTSIILITHNTSLINIENMENFVPVFYYNMIASVN